MLQSFSEQNVSEGAMEYGSISQNTVAGQGVPHVLFFGMQGNFSARALAAVLQHGIEVCAVVIPALSLPALRPPAIRRRIQPRPRRAALSLQSIPGDFFQLASTRGIPIWEVRSFSHPETVDTLASYQPDFICVACFSRRIPRVLLDIPRLACLNVHPSLLPANRGPVPLFWILREGREVAGVTIHELAETMDSGAILAQEAVPIPDGGSYEQLEARCALLGGELLARMVWDVYQGRATRRPQDESKSSYQTFPEASDLVIEPSDWQARHLYNFIRGVRNWDYPLLLSLAGRQWVVRDAVAFGDEEALPSLEPERAMQWEYRHLVTCRAGWVRVLLHPHEGEE